MPVGFAQRAPSIRSRLLLSALLSVLLGALVSAAVAAYAVSRVVEELMKSSLEETAQALVVLAEDEGRIAGLAQGGALPAPPHREAITWQLRSADGQVIARSHDAPGEAWPVPLFEGHQQADGLAVFTIAGQRLWLQVAQPLSQLRRAQVRAAGQAGAAVMLVSVLAAAVLAWRIRRELWPVAQMAAEVEAIDPAPMVPSLPRSPRRELEPVYRALEGLLQRLAQKLRSERAFATHAAHSLRTPLAGLSAQIEVARLRAPDELLPRLDLMQESARRLTGVVEALLTMTRASSPAQWRRFEAQVLARVALARRIEVDASRLADAPALDGDPDLLSVAVSNLVDNAARHGARRVRIGASRDPRMQCIEIADDGPGVTAQRLGALRNALARFDASGEIDPALGLGLTLAAAVARAHGGRVGLDCMSTPAPGFCARLCWPPLLPTDSATSAPS